MQHRALALLALLSAGCSTPTPSVEITSERIESARSDASPEELQERLRACEQVSNLSDRDDALVSVALDAAASDQAGLCIQTLERIAVLSKRDAVAAGCARLAMRHATLADARRIAEKIRTISLRDTVFGEIARGAG